MFENTPSDRVQVRHLGSLIHPGACALCGSGNCEAGYLDTGVYYEYEGQVYFCMTCVHQMINAVGGLLPDEVLHLKGEMSEIAKSHTRLEEENAELHDRLSTWNSVIARAASDGLLGVPIGPVQQSNDGDVTESVKVSADGKPIPTKSVTKRRPNDASQSTVRNGEFTI